MLLFGHRFLTNACMIVSVYMFRKSEVQDRNPQVAHFSEHVCQLKRLASTMPDSGEQSHFSDRVVIEAVGEHGDRLDLQAAFASLGFRGHMVVLKP